MLISKISWQIIPAIIITLLAGFGVHSCSMNNLKTGYEGKLADQKTEMTTQCSDSKDITTKLGDENAKNTATVDDDFNNYILRDKTAGADIVTVTSQSEPAKAENKELPKGNGLSVERLELRLLAKKADKILVDYNTCLDNLDAIYR